MIVMTNDHDHLFTPGTPFYESDNIESLPLGRLKRVPIF
jgi:hypothetical protein